MTGAALKFARSVVVLAALAGTSLLKHPIQQAVIVAAEDSNQGHFVPRHRPTAEEFKAIISTTMARGTISLPFSAEEVSASSAAQATVGQWRGTSPNLTSEVDEVELIFGQPTDDCDAGCRRMRLSFAGDDLSIRRYNDNGTYDRGMRIRGDSSYIDELKADGLEDFFAFITPHRPQGQFVLLCHMTRVAKADTTFQRAEVFRAGGLELKAASASFHLGAEGSFTSGRDPATARATIKTTLDLPASRLPIDEVTQRNPKVSSVNAVPLPAKPRKLNPGERLFQGVQAGVEFVAANKAFRVVQQEIMLAVESWDQSQSLKFLRGSRKDAVFLGGNCAALTYFQTRFTRYGADGEDSLGGAADSFAVPPTLTPSESSHALERLGPSPIERSLFGNSESGNRGTALRSGDTDESPGAAVSQGEWKKALGASGLDGR